MRALDRSNLQSFAAQVAVHQSYCDGTTSWTRRRRTGPSTCTSRGSSRRGTACTSTSTSVPSASSHSLCRAKKPRPSIQPDVLCPSLSYGPSLGQHGPIQARRALGPCWAYILGREHDLVRSECNSC
jgi:hypothetical protein